MFPPGAHDSVRENATRRRFARGRTKSGEKSVADEVKRAAVEERGVARVALEEFDEIVIVRDADGDANLGERHIRVGQEVLREFDAFLEQVVAEGAGKVVLEDGIQFIFGDEQVVADTGNRNFVLDMGIDIQFDLRRQRIVIDLNNFREKDILGAGVQNMARGGDVVMLDGGDLVILFHQEVA